MRAVLGNGGHLLHVTEAGRQHARFQLVVVIDFQNVLYQLAAVAYVVHLVHVGRDEVRAGACRHERLLGGEDGRHRYAHALALQDARRFQRFRADGQLHIEFAADQIADCARLAHHAVRVLLQGLRVKHALGADQGANVLQNFGIVAVLAADDAGVCRYAGNGEIL